MNDECMQGELEGGKGELSGERGRCDLLLRQGPDRGHVHKPYSEGPACSGVDTVCIGGHLEVHMSILSGVPCEEELLPFTESEVQVDS